MRYSGEGRVFYVVEKKHHISVQVAVVLSKVFATSYEMKLYIILEIRKVTDRAMPIPFYRKMRIL
jgi:hypothetical protein